MVVLASGPAHERYTNDVLSCTALADSGRLREIGTLEKSAFCGEQWGMVRDGPDSVLADSQGHLPLQSWPGPLTGVGLKIRNRRRPEVGSPPQEHLRWGYFGGSGRSRSAPLDGLRSGVPAVF